MKWITDLLGLVQPIPLSFDYIYLQSRTRSSHGIMWSFAMHNHFCGWSCRYFTFRVQWCPPFTAGSLLYPKPILSCCLCILIVMLFCNLSHSGCLLLWHIRCSLCQVLIFFSQVEEIAQGLVSPAFPFDKLSFIPVTFCWSQIIIWPVYRHQRCLITGVLACQMWQYPDCNSLNNWVPVAMMLICCDHASVMEWIHPDPPLL